MPRHKYHAHRVYQVIGEPEPGALVAGYARYSSELQDPVSIVTQKRRIQEYCDRKGWTIIRWYEEPERSAKYEDIEQRPIFAQLLADAGGVSAAADGADAFGVAGVVARGFFTWSFPPWRDADDDDDVDYDNLSSAACSPILGETSVPSPTGAVSRRQRLRPHGIPRPLTGAPRCSHASGRFRAVSGARCRGNSRQCLDPATTHCARGSRTPCHGRTA
jgi:hypothetical protein